MIENIEAKDRIILALDVDTLDEVRELVCELKDYVGSFKIGLPIIVNYGYEAVRLIESLGAKCYYDGKFHDIPHTVEKACQHLVKNDVGFSFLPTFTVQSELDSGALEAIPTGLAARTITAVCGRHKNKWISPLMHLFLELCANAELWNSGNAPDEGDILSAKNLPAYAKR